MNQPADRTAPPLDHRLPEQAGQAFITVWCRSQEQVAGHVPRSQLAALEAVAANPDLSLRALADSLGVIPSSASRLCDRLVSAGLLVRTPRDDNRRQVALRPTPTGDELLRDLSRRRQQDLEAVLNRMTAESREELLRGLAAFTEAAGQ
ncbi:MarR family transcriptional regulator [Spirillospora sp. NPDC049652]